MLLVQTTSGQMPDEWTAEQQADFWARLEEAWKADVQSIVTYVNANYRDAYAESYTRLSARGYQGQ